MTFSTARKVPVSFSQLKKDCWPFFQILASYGYFSIVGNHVRNIFSTDFFNGKKGSRQFFSTELITLILIKNFMMPN